jgi:hypothetical protein
MRKNASGGLWKYLDELGVLEKGSDEEIKAAKRKYKKGYIFRYKQEQRKKKPEYSIAFSKENGELERILNAAKRHHMSIMAFVAKASLAYLDKTYIVPDRMQVAQLQQLLSECLNEIRTLVSRKELFFWDKENKLHAIERRIEKLEGEIHEVFYNPPLKIIPYDSENKIA